jgi:hypothetical protein
MDERMDSSQQEIALYKVLPSCFVDLRGGADKSLTLQRKQQATGLKKYIYSAYFP